jgi:hypothetical protein
MPNLIGPRGFVPSRYLDGGSWNGGMNMYLILAADASVYSVGDAVKSAAGADANGISAVTKAAGTDYVRGVIQGVFVSPPNSTSLAAVTIDLNMQQIPAVKTKDYYVMVVDDPSVLFEIQDDGLAALPTTACNKNAIFTVANPTAPQQNSATVLSTASVAVTGTLSLKLMGLVQKPGNAFGVNANWLVKLNLHELQGATAGA